MELVKDDLGCGQFFLTALMYGSHMSIATAMTRARAASVNPAIQARPTSLNATAR